MANLKERLEAKTTLELETELEKAYQKLAREEQEILETTDLRWLEILEVWAENTVERIETIKSVLEEKKVEGTELEIVKETVFKVGQRFRMEKLSGGIGAREAEIIKIEKNVAIVKIGNTSYKANIKNDYLVYPWNMRTYCNTRITDLIK